ncbi:hypothetical protein EV1_014849 [Malus domestica]
MATPWAVRAELPKGPDLCADRSILQNGSSSARHRDLVFVVNPNGHSEIIDDASRCFNCGSYNHSLKKCPKPRNNAAVNSARKQLKSKRNQNAGSCNPTRYYQKSSAAGKYDGLRPGVLDAETQKLLETILIRLEIY